MWPWEHLAVGYLAYAGLSRVTWGRPASARAALAVAFGSQFPDLVDKPLGWWLGVLPGGTTLAHSLVFAVPLSLVVLAAGRLVERERPALAFVVGYLAHIPADALYPALVGSGPKTWFLLWPLTPAPTDGPTEAIPHLLELVGDFVEFLATPTGVAYLLAEFGLLAVASAVWLRDGRPGLRWPVVLGDRSDEV